MGLNNGLRRALVDSHVAAIAILALLGASLYTLSHALRTLWLPAGDAVMFVSTAVAIRGTPSSPLWGFVDRIFFLESAAYLPLATTDLFLAWALSRWVYGTGPLNSLRIFRIETLRRVNVPATKDGTRR
jgi:hypothetical protein